MNALIPLIAAAALAGCATTPPETDQPPAETGGPSGWMLVTGLVAGVALAVALSAGGDDSDPPDDERCVTVIGGGTQDRSCQ